MGSTLNGEEIVSQNLASILVANPPTQKMMRWKPQSYYVLLMVDNMYKKEENGLFLSLLAGGIEFVLKHAVGPFTAPFCPNSISSFSR